MSTMSNASPHQLHTVPDVPATPLVVTGAQTNTHGVTAVEVVPDGAHTIRQAFGVIDWLRADERAWGLLKAAVETGLPEVIAHSARTFVPELTERQTLHLTSREADALADRLVEASTEVDLTDPARALELDVAAERVAVLRGGA